MTKVINKILTALLGDEKDFSFEERLVLTYILCGGIVCFSSIFIDLSLGLGLGTIIVISIAFFLFAFLFVIGRIFKKTHVTRLILTIYTLLFCNMYWYFNYGSRGSGTFVFLIYYLIMIFAWRNKQTIIINIIVLINIMLLFGIEMAKPEIIPFYPTERARISDSYTTLIIILVFSSIIIISAKNNYIKQFKLAQHSDKLKSAFLANMSHEIRTPLNAIMGFTGLLTERELSKEKKEKYGKLITESGIYLMKLISDILDVSMIESGQMKVNFRQLDLSELFSKIYLNQKQMYGNIQNKDVQLILNLPFHNINIAVDEFRLEQIIANLVNNSMKFTSKGYIKFGYIPDEEHVLFYVEDTGSGIKEEFQPEIFNRFVKNEENVDVRLARGAGIGLSLCKNLVFMMGGKIWFTSEYMKGTTFYFTLPNKN